MMEYYTIFNEHNVNVASLSYNENTKEFSIKISREAQTSELPFLFQHFASQGIFELDKDWSKRWVTERIVPHSRQNIGAILKANNMENYDEMQLLALADGRCCQDDCYIVKF